MGELDKYFIVKVQEIHYAYYEVYTETEDQAKEEVLEGKFMGSEFSHSNLDTAQIVKDYGE